jgi:hypothetical protein
LFIPVDTPLFRFAAGEAGIHPPPRSRVRRDGDPDCRASQQNSLRPDWGVILPNAPPCSPWPCEHPPFLTAASPCRRRQCQNHDRASARRHPSVATARSTRTQRTPCHQTTTEKPPVAGPSSHPGLRKNPPSTRENGQRQRLSGIEHGRTANVAGPKERLHASSRLTAWRRSEEASRIAIEFPILDRTTERAQAESQERRKHGPRAAVSAGRGSPACLLVAARCTARGDLRGCKTRHRQSSAARASRTLWRLPTRSRKAVSTGQRPRSRSAASLQASTANR